MRVTEVRLGDLLSDVKSGFASGVEAADGIFQVRMNNVTKDGTWDLEKKRYVPAKSDALERFALKPGDVLFNATNTRELVGKTALVKVLDEPTVFSNHFIRLRTDPELLDPAYLAHWLIYQFQRGVFAAVCRRWVNQASVTRDRLVEITVPVFPLGEQRRIARTLDVAGTLRARGRLRMAKLDQLAAAVFAACLGGGGHHRVPRRTLADVLSAPLGNGLSPSSAGTFPGEVLTLTALATGRFDSSARKPCAFSKSPAPRQYVTAGTFLVSRGNGNVRLVGRGAFVRDDLPGVVYPDTMVAAKLSPNLVTPEFFEHAWMSPSVRNQIENAARTTNGTFKVNQAALRGITFPCPDMSIQREFSVRARQVGDQKRRALQVVPRFDALVASLQSRAFKGQL